MSKLINIDNGGTLTDICVIDGDRIVHTKTITTPYDLSKCFIDGLKKASQELFGEEDLVALLKDTAHIRYSTTQGTNALVEKKGQRLGLITDRAADMQLFRRTPKEDEMFAALVGERFAQIDADQDGSVDTVAIVETVNRLTADGAQRIVVSFSGENCEEREARFGHEILRLFPRHLLGAVPILYASSLSSDFDMGRRTWTALNNAFLHPAMERFLYHAENLLRPYRMRQPLLIYRNDGFSGRVAKTTALRTYSSGPRGGMEGALAYAQHYGFRSLVSFDVGGTTTDIGLIENGGIKSLDRGDIEGVACSFPLCDIVSIGVGGGSIFRAKEGRITVGPDSVGGAPGPACFGLGGQQATITDALLLMGLIDPATYFGGKMKLDAARAEAVIEEKIATPLGIDVPAAVHAMYEAWIDAIARGIETFTKITPDMVLMAFGGGGPMAALATAQALGLSTVLVPRLAAVFSASGIGFSDIAHTADARLPGADPQACQGVLDALREKVLRDMFSEGCEADECVLEVWTEQGEVRAALNPVRPEWPSNVDGDVMLVVRARKSLPHMHLPAVVDLSSIHPKEVGVRRLLDKRSRTHESLPLVRVEDQQPGTRGVGPAVMEEAFWTCPVLPGWRYEFTANGDIVFRREAI
ncbi:hydantoinase/oxoprolinase family protein [Paraburkholderia denitrificans]|uniref:Hydantoinase/oxoprolinase family protein n=1 Tax=Paraburkholderia denitrificans TaxID=694025 RepID=A0ABW0JCK0_9BURK